MCRLAGIVSLNEDTEDIRRVNAMTDAMAHGGPDDRGNFHHGGVTLGHRRLSIIDLSAAGHQPMVHSSNSLVISYNGEIYNYKELRRVLQAEGINFRTATDTEIILEMYRTWGSSSFSRLRGIFAFAIHDIVNNRLVLVRDWPGVKPLYYYKDDRRLLFASEVKAFKAYDPTWEEDASWKHLFLAFGYLPHPVTTLKGVHALSPGCMLEVDLGNLSFKQIKYSKNTHVSSLPDEHSALELTRNSVTNALRRNIISDAPLGVFLSGGIDSSLLTLLASKEIGENLQTVSINFEEATFDERKYQELVLAKSGNKKHLQVKVTEKMFWDSWDEIWSSMDQPTIDGVNSWFVSMAARQAGLKAVLSGLGADELFDGYASSARTNWLKYLRHLPARDMIGNVAGRVNNSYKRLAFLRIDSAVGDYLFLRGIHTPASISRMLQCTEESVWQTLNAVQVPQQSEGPALSYAGFLEFNFYMRNQLLKDTDFMSMHHALEVRVPFLDQDLVDSAVAARHLVQNDRAQPKYLLTRAFEDILPPEIIFRKKHGFTFPFHVWLRNRLNSGTDFLNHSMNTKSVQEFLGGKSHWSRIWSNVVLDRFRY